MGKLLCDSTTVAETTFQTPTSPVVHRRDDPKVTVDHSEQTLTISAQTTWEDVIGLEDQQRRHLQRLQSKGVLWKHPKNDESYPVVVFKLSHGGDVLADGNCLFTASQRAMLASDMDARGLRRRTVRRFVEDFGSVSGEEREAINDAIKHMYSPDLKNGWGIHVVQEVKLLAKKEDRVALDSAIGELVLLGMQREMAAESIYNERCVAVNDGPSWAKYMSISGSHDDEYDIITLQYTEEGLLSIDENREGHAAFGDDIAIEFLATEFKREIYVIPVWFDAMQEEINALHSQHTWTLVQLPHHKNLVGCKWIFKIKRNADGTIARHKARLVAQGFSQEAGLDYGETYSPVVKPTTVRLVFALAAQYGWLLRQLDVKNAFLHGILHEEVFMAQPPGFVNTEHSQLVCKLHKSLYGLKQAPRAWNDRFTDFLPSLGFQHTCSDSSLFVKHLDQGILILLVYVDDIVITGSDPSAIHTVIHSLTAEFEIKDLGQLHYFLGIQISHENQGLFLSQSQYIRELLLKTDMADAKACNTPCLPHQRLLKDDGVPFENPKLYRSIVGALQYLIFTRPDIAFSVHQVCQFMQNPMVVHFTAVKRILRYLKGTASYGISYSRGSMELQAFSDADWAGDPNDRRSTTGFVVFLGSKPICWSSKKQQTVSRSSTEAEYRALSSTAAELDWIQQLLVFLHIDIAKPPVIFCDNLSAIALSFNPVQHQRTKHIEIDVHFVRERVANDQLFIQFVSSKEQFADILTKGLSSPLFRIHCCNLMLGMPKHEFEGGC